MENAACPAVCGGPLTQKHPYIGRRSIVRWTSHEAQQHQEASREARGDFVFVLLVLPLV